MPRANRRLSGCNSITSRRYPHCGISQKEQVIFSGVLKQKRGEARDGGTVDRRPANGPPTLAGGANDVAAALGMAPPSRAVYRSCQLTTTALYLPRPQQNVDLLLHSSSPLPLSTPLLAIN
jgi:hypothetical protein